MKFKFGTHRKVGQQMHGRNDRVSDVLHRGSEERTYAGNPSNGVKRIWNPIRELSPAWLLDSEQWVKKER